MNYLAKTAAGQRVRRSVARHNEMVDAIQEAQLRRGLGKGPSPFKPRYGLTTLVRNVSSEAMNAFTPVALTGAVATFADGVEGVFGEVICLDVTQVVDLAEELVDEPVLIDFAILVEPLAVGALGEAIQVGLAPCILRDDLETVDFQYAAPNGLFYAQLQKVEEPNYAARIIWQGEFYGGALETGAYRHALILLPINVIASEGETVGFALT